MFTFGGVEIFWNTAKLAARQLVEKCQVSYPVDLSVISKEMSAEICKTTELPEDILGSARLSNGGIWIIFVNINQIYSRQRFTIAHEIGHIALKHRCADYHLMAISDGRQERQANVFAAELLMPVREFKDIYFNRHIISPEDIADYFQVSRQTAEIRITEINSTVSFPNE